MSNIMKSVANVCKFQRLMAIQLNCLKIELEYEAIDKNRLIMVT